MKKLLKWTGIVFAVLIVIAIIADGDKKNVSDAAPTAAPETTAPAKPQALSSDEEARWIQNVKQHRTADGATVAEVLAYAEKLRPRKFKVSTIEVAYGGESGEPSYVSIGYWIGFKRLPGDVYIDLGYDMIKDGQLKPVPKDAADRQPTLAALEAGRDAFLQEVDGMYKSTCRPDPKAEPDC